MKKIALLLVALAGLVETAAAQAPDRYYSLQIDRQPLAGTLKELSKQTGLQLVGFIDTAQLNGGTRLVGPLTGRYTAEAALAELLANSGFIFKKVNERTIVIVADQSVHLSSGGAPARGMVPLADDRQAAHTRWTFMKAEDTGPFRSSGGSLGGSSEKEQLAEFDEEVIVTGTHIRGTENSTAPVIVLDKEYIDSTGYGTTSRLIESLPQNFALANQSAVNVPGVSHSSAQGASINLRGIGEGTTLTLINGRRVALGFLGRAVDISALPLSAIERVEVLTDGASAIYGSDAVGGVVNFILRRNFEGSETRLRAGAADELEDFRASQSLGTTWNSGSALVALEYYQRDMLRAGDRDFIPETSTIGSLLPEDENTSLMFTGRQELSSNVEAFADVLYSNRDSYNESGQIVYLENADMENPQLSATLGVSWGIGGNWRLETSGSYGRNKVDQVQDASYGPLALATLFEIEAAEVKADGPLLELPGGTVRLAIGADWRSESFEFAQSAGGLTVAQDFEQTVKSAFGELYIPIVGAGNEISGVRRLDLSIASRVDDYSKFGSSADPRFGVMWQPYKGLRVRASYGTSFVAPRLLDYDTSFNSASVNTFSDPASATGISRQLWVFGTDVATLAPQEAETWSFGAEFAPVSVPDLRFGLNYYNIEYEQRIADPPFPGVMLENPLSFSSLISRQPSVSQVQRAVAIGSSVGRFFDCEFDPIACSADPNFDPASIAVIVDARRRNLSLTKSNGIDVSVHYSFAAMGGKVQFGVDGTHILEIEQRVTPLSEGFDTVDTLYNPPNWRARASMGFERGNWLGSLFVNYADAYVDNRTGTLARVGSYGTVDSRIAYSFDNAARELFSGITLSLSAQNVFDKDPPATAILVPERDMGFDPTNASPLGRFIAVEITKLW